jgi:aerobic-type carbon monoxide dehydrogenase small subunit (CoxS/CutS family)
MDVKITLNGEARTLSADERRTVLEVLREDLGMTGTKYGCGEGECRACTILVDGEPVPSCQLHLSHIDGKDVRTIEGLARSGKLHPVQQAFLDAGAMQCGFCVPGMILTAVSLLENNSKPTDADIVEAMNGNLCRCCGYVNVLEAVRLAAGRGGAKRQTARKEAVR